VDWSIDYRLSVNAIVGTPAVLCSFIPVWIRIWWVGMLGVGYQGAKSGRTMADGIII
jgi:hypothetical protein